MLDRLQYNSVTIPLFFHAVRYYLHQWRFVVDWIPRNIFRIICIPNLYVLINKMQSQKLSAKWGPFGLGPNALNNINVFVFPFQVSVTRWKIYCNMYGWGIKHTHVVNSFDPGRRSSNIKVLFSKSLYTRVAWAPALRWMPQSYTNENSTLVQGKAWCLLHRESVVADIHYHDATMASLGSQITSNSLFSRAFSDWQQRKH